MSNDFGISKVLGHLFIVGLAANRPQQGLATDRRQQLEQKRLWQWQEHQRLRWQRQREQHQDELLLQEKARAAGLNQRAAQEQERRRQVLKSGLLLDILPWMSQHVTFLKPSQRC